MVTYIILSRFSPEAFEDTEAFKRSAVNTSEKIKAECPDVTWRQSFATIGRYDVVNIVESDDPLQVEKSAVLIRTFQHSTTETMLATPWDEFITTF